MEVYSSSGDKICNLQDLPEDRDAHTLNRNIVCGGTDQSVRKSCVFFESGIWKNFSWELYTRRLRHVSWMKPNGDIYLMGGRYEENTTEIIYPLENASLEGFNLKHPIM